MFSRSDGAKLGRRVTSILGISAFYHDSAAALVVDGRIVAAAQEERFTRKKYDHQFPANAVEYCLSEAGLKPEQLDYVGFYDKPLLKFERLLETYLSFAPAGFRSFAQAMPLWLKQKLYLPRELDKGLGLSRRKRYIFTEHHESHAASAFFPSPFEEAAILTVDGVGEWATASFGIGRGNTIALSHELQFPHSLGLLYSAFTYYTGFAVNSGEYKLMGLAPYGEPKYVERILGTIIDLKPDGSLRLDMSYFNYCQGLTMTSPKFHALFGGPPRKPDTRLTERDMDIAASIQKVTEEVLLRMARHVHDRTGMKNLCLAGGVALNCVANQHVLRSGPFENIWIQPAAGDAGGALGVALFIWHQLLGKPRTVEPGDSQRASLIGPEYGDVEIRRFLDGVGATYTHVGDDGRLCDTVAQYIADGQVIGWFQGRMEFGPRALGARSIIGDPRNSAMQTVMNVKVKFREGFRPFAPAVLREHAHEYFDVAPGIDAPYMLLVAPVHPAKRERVSAEDLKRRGIDKLKVRRSSVPAITHVDYSARIQTVDERHGLYRTLIESFYRKTGCPVIVNTSFNLGWDPIVNTPREAYETFMSCDMDALIMGHFVLTKSAQRSWTGAAGPAPGPGRPASGGPVSARAVAAPDAVVGDLWWSPCCHADLSCKNGHAACAECGRTFSIEDGIPLLAVEHEGGKTKAASGRAPRPNYDDLDSVRALIAKMRQDPYARTLNESAPYNSAVLEVGCGTGQLSNFLGVSCRTVVGTDICLDSLRLAEQFRSAHGLNRVRFVQTDPSHPVFKPEQFDVILQNGAPGGSGDTIGALKHLVQMLRPGGHLIVGLHNTYGRILPDLRRMFGPYADARAWLADGRDRSTHTVGEVLGWFRECGLDFVRSEPAAMASRDEVKGKRLLEPVAPDGSPDSIRMRARQLTSGSREGGYFLMIGRKPGDPGARMETNVSPW